MSSNPDLQPIHVTFVTKPQYQFSSNPEKVNPIWAVPFWSQIILATAVQCSCSGLEQSLATMLTQLQCPNVFLGQDATNATLYMENFPGLSSFVVIVVPNPWKVNVLLSKGCNLSHWKTLEHIKSRLRLENRQSSSIFSLIHVCLWYPLEWASIFDVKLCWNAHLECLNNLPFPQRSNRQHGWLKWIQYCDSQEGSKSRSLVIIWAQAPGVMNEAACSTLGTCWNITSSSVIRTSFLQ